MDAGSARYLDIPWVHCVVLRVVDGTLLRAEFRKIWFLYVSVLRKTKSVTQCKGRKDWHTVVWLLTKALIYFVLLNIFVAIVLDTFSLASRLYAVEADKKNPMIAAWQRHFQDSLRYLFVTFMFIYLFDITVAAPKTSFFAVE